MPGFMVVRPLKRWRIIRENRKIGRTTMKPGIHPDYRPVIFLDTSLNHSFLTRSAIDTKGRETMKWEDGKEYPVVKVEVSSESHSYYTGKHKIVDTAGRVEKFKRRYTKKKTA